MVKNLDKINLFFQVLTIVLVISFLYVYATNAMLITTSGETTVMCLMSSGFWELPQFECTPMPFEIEQAILYAP